MNKFMEMLESRQRAVNSLLCVGLDPDLEEIPACMGRTKDDETMLTFLIKIVEATHEYAGCFKPNITFFEGLGEPGIAALAALIRQIRRIAPSVPIIADRKGSEIGNSNRPTAKLVFDILDVDAVTVNPYLGAEAMKPFLERSDKGIIVLCRTSNPGASEFQNLEVTINNTMFDELCQAQPMSRVEDGWSLPRKMPLYQYVAHRVASRRAWNANGNCAVVVGATAPTELAAVRAIIGDMLVLAPGVGKQGGKVEDIVPVGVRKDGLGLLVNVGSSIIYASEGADFAEAAAEKAAFYRNTINQYRRRGS